MLCPDVDSDLSAMAFGLGWGPEDLVMALPPLFYYSDETGHSRDPNERAFGIGGLRATCAQWLTFNEKWQQLLTPTGIATFHMKKFYTAEPTRSWPDAKKDEFLMSLVDLIETIAPPIGAMKQLPADLADREDRLDEAYRNAYHGCIRAALSRTTRRVHFIFAIHPEVSQKDFEQYHGWIMSGYRQAMNNQRVGTIGFGEPKNLPPLQAADYVAWEFARSIRDPSTVRPTMVRLQKMRPIIYT